MVTNSAQAIKAKVVKPSIPSTAKPSVPPISKYIRAKKLTKTQLYDMLKTVGFKGRNLKVAWAVAMKETHGNPLAHNNNSRTGDNSYGVFQINLYGSLKGRVQEYGLTSANDLKDPVINAQVAYKMSSEGNNWSPWKADPGERDHKVVQEWIKAAPTESEQKEKSKHEQSNKH